MSQNGPFKNRDRETSSLLANSNAASEASSTVVSDYEPNEDVFPYQDRQDDGKSFDYRSQLKKNLVLLLSVYLVNSDSSILLAMFRQIASEYDRMQEASWIINSYLIGLIVAQPIYGKLSDIYGRKNPLLIAYCFYFVGAVLAGSGVSFMGVLIGRAIAGIGSSGITVLISTLIVDLVPMREVAVWRSYVYAVNMVGRALGPPIGGLIADNSNWRWALLYQAPIVFLTILFVWWKMSIPEIASEHMDEDELDGKSEWRAKLLRIDFAGSTTLGIANVALVLFLNEASKNLDFVRDWKAVVPLILWLVSLLTFLIVEGFFAHEPILPLRLLAKRNVFSSYIIQFTQTAAQVAIFSSLPLYFRVTVGDSTTTVALRLAIVTVGTIFGGLVSGFFIKRTGKFRLIILLSLLISNASLLAIFLRWRGNTSWLETLYGFPVGLGFGVSLSAAFIGLTSRLEYSQTAVATSGFYLSLNLGSLFGVSLSSLLIVTFVKKELLRTLTGVKHADRIIQDVVSNFDNINNLTGKVQMLVQHAYIGSLINVWLFAFGCGCLSLIIALVMQEGMASDAKPKRPSRDGYRTFSDSSDR